MNVRAVEAKTWLHFCMPPPFVWVDEVDTFKEIGCDKENLHFLKIRSLIHVKIIMWFYETWLYFSKHIKNRTASFQVFAKTTEFPYMCLLSICCDILFSTDGN